MTARRAPAEKSGITNKRPRGAHRVGEMRELQLIDHRLFVAVCHRHLLPPNRKIDV
jgi:hypothetical protein